LERIESERERKKEKKREVAAYSQQAWRRYNPMKTQGWSPNGMSIHALSMFFLMFLALFYVLEYMWIDEWKCCFLYD
jgi:hypothetical protein